MLPTVSTSDGRGSPVAPRRAGIGRIAEIDGLRAIALTLVVVYHLFGQGRVSGGVDVFFFVSGLVIALSLQSAVSRGETGGVLRRWSRTFSRLAPPAAVVLLAIVGLSFTILPPWLRSQTLTEVASAALYLENWQLIWSQLAYGAAGPSTSPVQHFWSLSVQAQIILVVPVLVAGVYLLRRVVRRPGLLLWLLAGGATAASFVYALVTQAADPASAYFDTFARFWEFGLGMLLAGALRLGFTVPRRISAALGWIGLAAILFSGFLVDGATAYPGPAALLPVGGAMLLVLSTRAPSVLGPGSVLRARPFVAFSRISYALYLWHWPVLIALLALTGGSIGWSDAAIVLAISLVLASATWLWLERPLGRVLSGSARVGPSAGAAVGSAAIVVLVAVGLGVAATPARAGEASAAQAGRILDPSESLVVEVCLGAAALDPERPECADALELHADPIPAFDALRQDEDHRPECWATLTEPTLDMCSVGLTEGYTRHLFAVGDSHSNTLVGVYEEIALARGWRIDVAGREGCHWTHATRKQANDQATALCGDWNALVDEHVAASDELDAIIVMNSSRSGYVIAEDEVLEDVRTRGFVDAWASRADSAVPIIGIRDNPIFPLDRLGCILDPADVAAGVCDFPRDVALREDGLAAAVAADPHAMLVDLTDYMCTPDACPMIVGGVIVTRDGFHLTDTFAHTLAPYLDRALVGIVESLPARAG